MVVFMIVSLLKGFKSEWSLLVVDSTIVTKECIIWYKSILNVHSVLLPSPSTTPHLCCVRHKRCRPLLCPPTATPLARRQRCAQQ